MATPTKKSTPVKKSPAPKVSDKSEKYVEGIGRRKTSIARVRIVPKGTGITVNDKDYHDYFPTEEMQSIVEEALKVMDVAGKMKVMVRVQSGGIHSQAEAIRHGMAPGLVKLKEESLKTLRKADLL